MRLILIVMIAIVLSGCVTTQPKIQVNVYGDFESRPTYSVTLTN